MVWLVVVDERPWFWLTARVRTYVLVLFLGSTQ